MPTALAPGITSVRRPKSSCGNQSFAGGTTTANAVETFKQRLQSLHSVCTIHHHPSTAPTSAPHDPCDQTRWNSKVPTSQTRLQRELLSDRRSRLPLRKFGSEPLYGTINIIETQLHGHYTHQPARHLDSFSAVNTLPRRAMEVLQVSMQHHWRMEILSSNLQHIW